MSPMKDEMSRAQMSADSMRVGDAALRFCGIQVEDVAPGRASGRMTVTDEMVNGYGLRFPSRGYGVRLCL